MKGDFMTVMETPKSSVFKTKSFLLGTSIGAIVVLVITAITVTIITLKGAKHEATSHWDYHHQDKWPETCLEGQMQSPIALSDGAAIESTLEPLNFQNLDYFENIEVTNNGHTVSVKLFNRIREAKPRVSGGKLLGNYTFENMHFHWPSEHTINGLRFLLEAHLVFIGEGYENFDEALQHPYAITVVAILFEESAITKHNDFKVLDSAVDQVSKKTGQTTLTDTGITFSNFFPKDRQTFFAYTGALTTPDCTEKVNWIVYKNPSTISLSDLKDLIHIYTEDHELLEWNNRLLQEVNNRPIYLHSVG